MNENEWIALGGFVTICASACALVIKQVEPSWCTNIECGCLKCQRRLPESDEDEAAQQENGP